MKRLELVKLQDKSIKELEKQLIKLRLQKAEKQAKIAVGKEKNLKAASGVKRDIAQILTVIRQKGAKE